MTLQTLEIVNYFLPLELDSTDVILGVQWLETLGETIHHWREHTMKLTVGSQQVVLRGDPLLHKTRVSFKHMVRLLRSEKQGIWVVGSLLTRFAAVFATSTGLPPPRIHDHAISLLPGNAPINVWPYRYPYHIKDEVEKLVREMLASGVI